MQLSGELFDRMITSLKGDSPISRGSEKRTSPRVGIRCKVKMYSNREGKLAAAEEFWTRDISAHGLGIMCHREIRVGSKFVMPLESNPQKKHDHVVLHCTVRRCNPLSQGLYCVGLSFDAVRYPQADLAGTDDIQALQRKARRDNLVDVSTEDLTREIEKRLRGVILK